jgi:hypothetical protein
MNTNWTLYTLSHQHDWQPINGWTARYRCKGCRVVGYRPRIVTLHVAGGPYGSTAVTPYICSAQQGGQRCGCPAEWKQKRAWRCREHLLNSSHTATARAALVRNESAARPSVSASKVGKAAVKPLSVGE